MKGVVSGFEIMGKRTKMSIELKIFNLTVKIALSGFESTKPNFLRLGRFKDEGHFESLLKSFCKKFVLLKLKLKGGWNYRTFVEVIKI